MIEPRCPRCGYDLRGVVSVWGDACPLEGRCTECGLVFEWGALLVPEKFEPLWCVEFAPDRRQVPRACVTTAWRTFWPWGFWSRMQMSFDVRWRRLAVYLSALVALVLATLVVVQAGLGLATWLSVNAQASAAQRLIVEDTQPQLEHEQAALAELGEDDDGATRRNLQQQIQRLRDRRASPKANLPTVWQSVWWSVSSPMGHELPNGYVYEAPDPYAPSNVRWIDTVEYPPPARQRDKLAYLITGNLSPERYEVALAFSWVYTIVVMVLMIGIPLLFVLLPISRKRAKVRWRHIWRVAAYSFVLPVVAVIAFSVLINAGLTTQLLYKPLLTLIHPIAWAAVCLMVATWATAIGRYMKMPHAWSVAILFAILSMAVPLVVFAWIAILLSSPY